MRTLVKTPLAIVLAIALCCGICPALARADEAAVDAAPAAKTALTAQAAKESLATLAKNGQLKVALAKSKNYTGKAIKPKPALKLNGKKLTLGRDYTVVYKNAKGKAATPKAVGTYKVVIKGKGSYKGSITRTFKVTRKPITIKAKTFKVTLPRYWSGKVKRMSNTYGSSRDVWIGAKKGGPLLQFRWMARGEDIYWGDVSDAGYKEGSKYRVYVGTIAWTLNREQYSVFDISKSQATNLVKLLTGGKVKKLSAQSNDKTFKRIQSYVVKNVIKNMKVY